MLMIRNLAYASASAASTALLLVLLVAAGRTLGDAEFGKFAFALALGTIFETLMDFGLQQVTIRAVARDRSSAPELLQHVLGIKLMWAGGALAALVTTAVLLRSEPDVRIACILIGGSLVLRSYMLTIRGFLQGLEFFGWDSIVVAVDRALLLAFGLGALASHSGLRGLVIAFVAARAAALALAVWLTRTQIGNPGIRFDRAVWRDLQATAVPFGIFLVVMNLYSYVDSIMLGKMRSDAETGLYTAAYKMYEGLTYAAAVLAAVLTPRLATLFVTDRRKHRRLALLGVSTSAGLAILIGAAGYSLARPLIQLAFGPTFVAAAEPFRILCLGLTFVFPIWALYSVAISVNREQALLKMAVVGLTVNIAVNLYLIPRMGGNGAALSTVFGEFVSMLVLLGGVASALTSAPPEGAPG
jgi:O-antigen/teichoic acid export membrane protein